jgi:DNA-binding transcriptional regulator YdaS (Cro superfamily)
MDLITYRFMEKTNYRAMAKLIGIQSEYLNSIATGRTQCGPKMAIKIEKGLGGKVLRGDVRPDLWPPDPRKAVISE